MNTGKITQISGPVIDCRFAPGELPKIKEALTVNVKGAQRVMEVAQHTGKDRVRCILLGASENLARGMEVTATGRAISVPVGDRTLGRMFNVLGETIDGSGIRGAAAGGSGARDRYQGNRPAGAVPQGR